jgi:hypothetical protein
LACPNLDLSSIFVAEDPRCGDTSGNARRVKPSVPATACGQRDWLDNACEAGISVLRRAL